MRKKRIGQITVTAIAKATGLSVATVSRALNDSGQVSSEARKKVLEYASETNYVVDPRYRAMGKVSARRPHRTGNIGLLLPEARQTVFITDPYYARLFWSIESSAKENGFHITTATVSTDEGDDFLPRFVGDLNVDGVLMSGIHRPKLIHRIASLMPIVLVNYDGRDLEIPSIMPDEDAAIRKALGYLRGLGHREIVYFDIHDDPSVHHRMRAEAFGRHSAEFPSESSVILSGRTKSMEETALDTLKAWKDAKKLPTALICAADIYAFAFLEAAEKLQIRVPETLSVVGIDNTVFCERSRPKLTSICQPLEEMGKAAIRVLKRQLDADGDDEAVAAIQFYDVKLIEREILRALAGTRIGVSRNGIYQG